MEDEDKETEVEVVEDGDEDLPSSDDYEAKANQALEAASAESESIAATQMLMTEALVYSQLATMATIREATWLLIDADDE